MNLNSAPFAPILILKKKPKGTVCTTSEEDFLTCVSLRAKSIQMERLWSSWDINQNFTT